MSKPKKKKAEPKPKKRKRPRGPDIVISPRNRGNISRVLEDHSLRVDSLAAEFRRKSYHC